MTCRISLFICIFSGCLIVSCEKNIPEKIYINGDIWTGKASSIRAEAIAVQGETILAIGDNRNIEALKGKATRIIDLEGQFVVPGFIDCHTHLMNSGFQLIGINLRESNNREEFIQTVRAFARDLPPENWILNGDWDHERWGGELPHRSWIDSITKDIPVFISRLDGHMALANSKALHLAGISSDTPDPQGGIIVRDKIDGKPTGILKDGAMSLMSDIIPQLSEGELDELYRIATNYVLARGITQIHDMGSWRDFETYLRARKRGDIRLRITLFIWYEDLDRLVSYIAEHGRGDDWLRWNGIKAMVDGSLGSRTAWMYDPYLDDSSTRGLVINPDTTELKKTILNADRAGLQLAIHAIGDRANDWILNFGEQIEKNNGVRDRRMRIEHSQHLRKESIERFASSGIIPSMQPYHLIDDGVWAGKRVNSKVLNTSYAFRSLLDGGAALSFGSDWSVAPISPLKGIYAAVTRRTVDGKHPDGWFPEQKITLEEALKAYTMGGAYAGFQEDRSGTLEVDKLADFVVLSEDLFKIDPVNIPDVKVLRTVVGGHDRFINEMVGKR